MNSVDTALLEALYSVREPTLILFFLWITVLGQVGVVYVLSLLSMIWLTHKRRIAYAVALGISVGTAGALVLVLKGILQRPRPPLEFQAYAESWYAFPSAHSALAIAFYGLLAILCYRLMRQSRLRSAVVGICWSLVVLVPFSRLYLGVHYGSDVAVGILVGIFSMWLALKYEKIVRNGHS